MKKTHSINYTYIALLLSLGAILFIIYAFTTLSPFQDNPYNSFALQADSWLHGRLDLGKNYEYLELAIFKGKYFVSFPPFPSFILLPFAIFFGSNTPDHLIIIVSYFIGVIYAMKLAKEFLQDDSKSMFYAVFIMAGCNTLFTSVNGWVWFMAQNFAMTLTLMSLYYAKKKKCGLALLFWACAVGCRPFQIVYLPLLIYWMYDYNVAPLEWLKKKWKAFIPCAGVALSYMILNLLRFGNPLEFGHNYLPEFTRTETGQFDVSYIAGNLKNLFRLPAVTETGQLDFYYSDGVAFWLVSPLFISFIIALIYAIIKQKKTKQLKFELIVIPLCIVIHITMTLMHKTMGGWHFGNRYLNDILPLAMVGMFSFMPKESKLWGNIQYVLFMLGISLNVVGTIVCFEHWL